MHNSRGQTLIEAVIGLSILVIILGAVATSVLISINDSSFIKQQNQANKLAQQGIEYIRDRINNSGAYTFTAYTQYAGGAGVHCFNDFSLTPPPISIIDSNPCSTANIQSIFKREATFVSAYCDTSSFANGLSVTVNVYWTDGKCTSSSFCHSQKVTSCFLDPAKSLPSGGQPGI